MDENLGNAEGFLMDWLTRRPAPFYVERQFTKPTNPQSITFWEYVISRSGSRNLESVFLFDAMKSAGLNFTLLMNYYTCAQSVFYLTDAIDQAKIAVQNAKDSGSIADLAKAVDCLAYATTENLLLWIEYVEPQTNLDYQSPEVVEALKLCNEALEMGQQLKDYSILHRSTYNLGRIYHDLKLPESFDPAYHSLLKSFAFLEMGRAVEGKPDDPFWFVRRAEILQRLVEICTLEKSGKVKIEEMTYGFIELSQMFKDPWLAGQVIKRPIFFAEHKFPIAYRLIGTKNNVDVPLPVVYNLEEIRARLDADTAILDFTIGDKYVMFTLIFQGGVKQRLFDPATVTLGGWSRYFRPTDVDIHSSMGQLFSGKPGILWSFVVPFVNLTPEDPEHWDIHEETSKSTYAPSIPWQENLYSILFKSLDKQLDEMGIKHLIIIPDGALNLVPFQILKEKNKFLVDKFSISYAPNLSIVAESLLTPKPTPPQSILIIKDPSNTLVFSEVETAQIAQMFPPDKVTILDDKTATKENIAKAALDVDVVHFSTHGQFDSEDPAQSGLLIKDGQWLTLEDISTLKIRNGALVFLSACDTARLKLTSRFYSTGVSPSFLKAGAGSVVSTFWKVNALSAAKVSACFYENLIDSKMGRLESLNGAVDAVRRGQKASSTEEPEEYYSWGAFSLYGSWK